MLVNSYEMLIKAKEEKYAIPQFNINNLEWAKIILESCEKTKVPVILGVSEGALKYMGGPNTVVGMVKGLILDLNITIPVCIHLDHGTNYEVCKETIDAGFTSVMIDASKYPLEENISITKKVVDYAHERGATVEAEIGHVGGVEDTISATNKNADLNECIRMVNETGIDSLAPAIGTAHGLYSGDPIIDFNLLKNISETINIPLVMHGGSGVPETDIRKSIEYGINKININTELQVAWHEGVTEHINNNKDQYDPRKVIGAGKKNMEQVIDYKVKLFFGL